MKGGTKRQGRCPKHQTASCFYWNADVMEQWQNNFQRDWLDTVLPTKTYKPVVFEEKEKEILANEDIPLLKKEVRDKKKALFDSKYKTELKQERMAAMIKQAVDDAFMRKTLYKNANRSGRHGREGRGREDHEREESPRRVPGDAKTPFGGGPSGDPDRQHTPKRTRMRLPDGSIVEL